MSGLRKYMPVEALSGRRVVLVANMKPAAMRGVKSQAMVLAATSPDGERVPARVASLGCSVASLGSWGWTRRGPGPRRRRGGRAGRSAGTQEAVALRPRSPMVTSSMERSKPCLTDTLFLDKSNASLCDVLYE